MASADDIFAARDSDIARLIGESPLAWILVPSDPMAAIAMPVLVDAHDDGRPTSLLGHLPLRHLLVKTLVHAPRALFLFCGPNAYISPQALADQNWAPTWNFLTVKIDAHMQLNESLTDEALSRLVRHMEGNSDRAWTIEHLGARYDSLKSQVIGFRAEVVAVSARFKLGQDERPEVLDEILAGLGHDPLAPWMRRYATRIEILGHE